MPRPTGVWIAYYADWSSVVPFATEMKALRYAVENQMQVKFMEYGIPVQDQG